MYMGTLLPAFFQNTFFCAMIVADTCPNDMLPLWITSRHNPKPQNMSLLIQPNLPITPFTLSIQDRLMWVVVGGIQALPV